MSGVLECSEHAQHNYYFNFNFNTTLHHVLLLLHGTLGTHVGPQL